MLCSAWGDVEETIPYSLLQYPALSPTPGIGTSIEQALGFTEELSCLTCSKRMLEDWWTTHK